MKKSKLILSWANSFINLHDEAGRLPHTKGSDAHALTREIITELKSFDDNDLLDEGSVLELRKLRDGIENTYKGLMDEGTYRSLSQIFHDLIVLLQKVQQRKPENEDTLMGVYKFEKPEIENLFNSTIRDFVENHFSLHYEDGKKFHNSKALKMDKIFQQIVKSKILIMDLSYNSPNVFIEVGIGYKLRPDQNLIYIYRSNEEDGWDPEKIFDVEGRDKIKYTNEQDLIWQLYPYLTEALFNVQPFHPKFRSSIGAVSKSPAKFEFTQNAEIVALEKLPKNFAMRCRIKAKSRINSNSPADFRFILKTDLSDHADKLAFIAPWEGDQRKFSFHITHYPFGKEGDYRKQDLFLDINPIQALEYDVYITRIDGKLIFQVCTGNMTKAINYHVENIFEFEQSVVNFEYIALMSVNFVGEIERWELHGLDKPE